MVAQGFNGAPSIMAMNVGGKAAAVIASDGTYHQPIDDIKPDENNCVRIGQYSSIGAGNLSYFHIWDLVYDLKGVVPSHAGKYLSVPFHYIDGIKMAGDLYCKNQDYAGMTFEEFYRKMFNETA